jgi:hypothetical protein
MRAWYIAFMSEPKVPHGDKIRQLIEQVDAVCAEAAQTSRDVDMHMKRRRVWPDRGQPGRWVQFPERRDDAPPSGDR